MSEFSFGGDFAIGSSPTTFSFGGSFEIEDQPPARKVQFGGPVQAAPALMPGSLDYGGEHEQPLPFRAKKVVRLGRIELVEGPLPMTGESKEPPVLPTLFSFGGSFVIEAPPPPDFVDFHGPLVLVVDEVVRTLTIDPVERRLAVDESIRTLEVDP